jgi:hypothetical protein
MDSIPNEIMSILKEIVNHRSDVMLLAAQQRAKFEGWLKFELAGALCATENVRNVELEPPYDSGGKADLRFKTDSETWYIWSQRPRTSLVRANAPTLNHCRPIWPLPRPPSRCIM